MTAALAYGGNIVEGAELERRAARAASGLERLGIAEGEVVALMLYNTPAFIEAMLACRQLGAYSCPINWHYKSDEAGFILRDSGAKALVVQAALLEQIASGVPNGLALVTVEPGWSAWRDAHRPWSGAARAPRGNMPYTSGTTGRPKGVRRAAPTDAQRALVASLYRQAIGIDAGMRSLLSAPLYHSAPNLYAVQV